MKIIFFVWTAVKSSIDYFKGLYFCDSWIKIVIAEKYPQSNWKGAQKINLRYYSTGKSVFIYETIFWIKYLG